MSETVQPQGVVFIASDVPDLQDLLNGLQPGEQAFIIDPSSDGLQQIADILAANNLTDLTSISIVSHGASGELDLGSSPLIDPDLAGNSNALAEIGAALAPGGAIQLYGCDVAQGAAGQQFIDDFSTLAGGVTVEASTQIVGSAALGGSWTLDAVSNGTAAPVSSSPPFTSSALDQYQGELRTAPGGLPPPVTPTLSTTWGQGANPNALVLTDTADLENGNAGEGPTGIITFTLYSPSGALVDTETVSVNGDGTYTTPTGYTFPNNGALGGYQWDASYSGDVFNNSVSDVNNPDEQVWITVTPSLSTTPGSATVTLGPNPVTLTDKANLENGYTGYGPTGTITFTLYGPSGTLLDTETVNVNGNGTYTTPTGYTLSGSAAAVGTYQWDATYSGDSYNDSTSETNNSAERVTVKAAVPTLSTTPDSATVTLGPNPVTLTDTADLENGSDPTGTMTFTLYGPGNTLVDTETVAVNGNGTYTTPTGFTLPGSGAAVGTYQWDATYSGNASNNAASDVNDSAEQVTVNPAAPTLTATWEQPDPNALRVVDTADLENGYDPTGTITFTLYAPDGTTLLDTETVNVNGNGTYTTPNGYTFTDASPYGSYQWDAAYSGDASNNAVSDVGDYAEQVSLVAGTTLTTTPDPTTVTLSPNPVTLTDTADLENGTTGYDPTGTITFTLYGPGDATPLDTETVNVNGNGTYTTPTGYAVSTGAALGTYQWDADYSGDAYNSSANDDNDSTEQVIVAAPCYCPGTRIRTARGQKLVETLKIGDKVMTASGALRPIKWIGRRSYAGRFIRGSKAILPVCIKAGALGHHVPARDLWISPHHAMYFKDDGGVLIEAKDLVNGVSIVQAERVEAVEYFHVELETHDVIVAEGALSESFLDDDSRGMFHNAPEYNALYADDGVPAVALYCAPRLEDGYAVEAVRSRLAARAGLPRTADAPRLGALRGPGKKVGAARARNLSVRDTPRYGSKFKASRRVARG